MTDCELEKLAGQTARREAGIKAKARVESLKQALQQIADAYAIHFYFGQQCVVTAAVKPDAPDMDVGRLRDEVGLGQDIRQTIEQVVRQRLCLARAAYAEI